MNEEPTPLYAGDGPAWRWVSEVAYDQPALIAVLAVASVVIAYHLATGTASRFAQWLVERHPNSDTPNFAALYAYFVVGMSLIAGALLIYQLANPVIGGFIDDKYLREFGQRLGEDGDLRQVSFALAAMVAVLSIPLVFFRASVQAKQARTAAQLADSAIKQAMLAEQDLRQREETARKENITNRILRATELLGSTVEHTETRRLRNQKQGETASLSETPVVVQVPNIAVRLGAIYTLQSVGKESLSDHWSVVQTLLAYLRERRKDGPDGLWERLGAPPAPERPKRNEGQPQEDFDVSQDAWREAMRKWERDRIERIRSDAFRAAALEQQPEDVLAAISVLRRRSKRQLHFELAADGEVELDGRMIQWDPKNEKMWESFPSIIRRGPAGAPEPRDRRPNLAFELANTPLYGADLRRTNWQRQSVVGARVEGANLTEARFHGADVCEARFDGAKARQASFNEAWLDNARFDAADARDASFSGALARQARFLGAELTNANFENADAQRSDFRWAHLRGATFDGAKVDYCAFEGATLREATLDNAFAAFSDFAEADLTGATMDGLCLVGARLARDGAAHATGLTQEQLNASFGDGLTAKDVASLGFTAPPHWPAAQLDENQAEAQWKAWRARRGRPPAKP